MPIPREAGRSNLESFIQFTTPVVRPQCLPKSSMRNLNRLWHPWERETIEYFTLGDLWGGFDEWSAYGAGVPIELSNNETVIQYYVPYLSAIQIYTSSRSLANLRSFREESEAGDSFSDSCSESESEKLWRWDGGSSEDCGSEQESVCHLSDRLGDLYFQYFERSTPYIRAPLVDKINGLARRFPGLRTLNSVDLSPASWMAVYWYPIYYIPMGRNVKDLSACFLTYHTLSSSFLEIGPGEETESAERKQKQEGIALSPFGLATYKLHGSVWVSGHRDQEILISMFNAADSWLKQLRVQHHDFDYFTGARLG